MSRIFPRYQPYTEGKNDNILNSWCYFCGKLSKFFTFPFIKLIFHKPLLVSACDYQILIVPQTRLWRKSFCVLRAASAALRRSLTDVETSRSFPVCFSDIANMLSSFSILNHFCKSFCLLCNRVLKWYLPWKTDFVFMGKKPYDFFVFSMMP